MNIPAAIESFNEAVAQPIKLLTTRDARTVATLPRVGKEVIVEGSRFNPDIQVTATDLAWVCEEARRVSAAADALLQAALQAMTSPTAGTPSD